MAAKQLTLGYWAIKGLGAPLRMMCMYANEPFKADLCECTEKSDGGWNRECWTELAKPALKAQNPLINLPYLVDSDGTVVSQSNACFLYLGRKLGMLGDGSAAELSMCEQLLCEVLDLRNSLVGYAYSPRGASAEKTSEFFSSTHYVLDKLELVCKASTSFPFLVGSKASAPDFHLWEMLDQLNRIAAFHSLPSPVESFPRLSQFHKDFAALPANARYLASPLHCDLPMNNPMASVGAVPSGGAWVPGQQFTWAGKSGVY